jgi:hypothetical protein
MPTLKLEHGKKYRDRIGAVHEITTLETCKWTDEGYTHQRAKSGFMYGEDGKAFPGSTFLHPFDLMEEVQ